MLLNLFNRAGSTGHVFLVKGGKPCDMGLAYSGLLGPMTTVAVVPTVPQVLNFDVAARTSDNQELDVVGSLTAAFVPAEAMKSFDFTVNQKDGNYKTPWNRDLQAMVVEQVLDPIREAVKGLTIEEAISAHAQIAEAIKKSLTSSDNRLARKGVTLDSFSITSLQPNDEDLAESIGAEEREELLSAADEAKHDRQMKAATNARAIKEYDVETNIEVEKKRATLIEEQGKNAIALATTDAEAAAKRLEPFEKIDAGRGLVAALMRMAESGRIGTLNVGPELLTALGQTK